MPRIIPQYREEVKQKIVFAAFTLFIEKGYHGTTMGEIAESLGVTKPALYQYFPGKEDLFAAVAEHARQEFKGTLERAYAGRNIRDGSAALFDALLNYVPQFNGMYSEMLLLATRNDRLRTVLVQDRTEDIRVIERFISRQQETGLISSRLDPRVLAVACDALANGLLMDVLMGMDRDEAKTVWIAALEQMVRVGP
ncbi:MAG: TetR/AcrR family transcriptional regulator [Methanoregula sp.]|jgi:AcrR family transcriptional regulator|uniref:TetR/AcrR family transcriptional regulator n=1 Tax=Methanoregula sp. TaxID=2052170 RepID=UPI0025CE9486|nr:TetR/AcrR family transcriptional regulator [Methanoregula sp.]MCK9631672.1 TetR/AcrR family transcriptional regulator [Methanoregula sp.]